jgi:hypothetical protein
MVEMVAVGVDDVDEVDESDPSSLDFRCDDMDWAWLAPPCQGLAASSSTQRWGPFRDCGAQAPSLAVLHRLGSCLGHASHRIPGPWFATRNPTGPSHCGTRTKPAGLPWRMSTEARWKAIGSHLHAPPAVCTSSSFELHTSGDKQPTAIFIFVHYLAISVLDEPP